MSTVITPSAAPGRIQRNLVLLFDGTNSTFGSHLSNVPTLSSFLLDDPATQLNYYQSGIGTFHPMTSPTGIFEALSRFADLAVAWGLPTHIQAGYSYLMDYYQPGDRIFFFGFSRGAFEARALAGMLQQVGLLHPGNDESVPLAYYIYATMGGEAIGPNGSTSMADGFKKTFSREAKVHFIGAWDTVASVGAIIPRTLPFAQGTGQIKHFVQALALDERRSRFLPQMWMAPGPKFTNNSTSAKDSDDDSDDAGPERVKEVWFTGSHSNIGGGETANDGDTTPNLSHLTLVWMMREAVQRGLLLDLNKLKASPIFQPFLPLLDDIQATSSDNDIIHELLRLAALPTLPNVYLADSLAPRADALSYSISKIPNRNLWQRVKGLPGRFVQRLKTTVWWILEIFPSIKVTWDIQGQTRRWSIGPNLGRGRVLPPNPIFHQSVQLREAALPQAFPPGDGEGVVETHYVPKARYAKGQSRDNVSFQY